jgi:hypothetical protein
MLLILKLKVKLSHYMSWRRLGERSCSSYSFLTSALDGVEWSASRLGRALPPGKDTRYPLGRRVGGPRAGLDTEVMAYYKLICP